MAMETNAKTPANTAALVDMSVEAARPEKSGPTLRYGKILRVLPTRNGKGGLCTIVPRNEKGGYGPGFLSFHGDPEIYRDKLVSFIADESGVVLEVNVIRRPVAKAKR
jgi:hypothetical protein